MRARSNNVVVGHSRIPVRADRIHVTGGYRPIPYNDLWMIRKTESGLMAVRDDRRPGRPEAFPALKMRDRGDLPAAAAVLGIGRRSQRRTYRDRIAAAVRTAAGSRRGGPGGVSDRFHYHAMDMGRPAYDALRTHADRLSVSRDSANRLFFLPPPPTCRSSRTASPGHLARPADSAACGEAVRSGSGHRAAVQ